MWPSTCQREQQGPGAGAQLTFTLRCEAAFEDQQQVEVGTRSSLAASAGAEQPDLLHVGIQAEPRQGCSDLRRLQARPERPGRRV
jgi:hypothetical protein